MRIGIHAENQTCTVFPSSWDMCKIYPEICKSSWLAGARTTLMEEMVSHLFTYLLRVITKLCKHNTMSPAKLMLQLVKILLGHVHFFLFCVTHARTFLEKSRKKNRTEAQWCAWSTWGQVFADSWLDSFQKHFLKTCYSIRPQGGSTVQSLQCRTVLD